MRVAREQVEAVCLKKRSFELKEDLIDGMSNEEQYKLVRESLRLFLKCGRAEFPLLLKHFGIDLKSGQRLIEFMERKGYVGPELPDRTRRVTISTEQFEAMFGEGVTAYMHLDEQPFEAIASGKKTVELRVFDDKRRSLRVGDIVEFVSAKRSVRVEITDLVYAASFGDLDIATLYAAGLKETRANEVDEHMRRYYTKKEVAKNGVVAIFFEKIETF